MKKIECHFFSTGRLSSKVGLINKELDQTVVNIKNKKGGYKILKTPIYYSGILPCPLVLVIFTSFILMGCERFKLIEPITPISPSVTHYHYIVGYDVCSGVEVLNNKMSKSKGYLLISDDLKDTLLTYNLPDSLFVFPVKIMPTSVFGFNFFPEQYRFAYKIQMTYQIASEEQKMFFPCITLYPQLYSIEPVQIIITSIHKNQ
jgi:hypothetical protein